MLGRNHATLGALAILAGASLYPADPIEIALAATCAAGAAVLPDLDHPNASVSRVIPIAGPVLSHTVSALAGGHRNRTHTLEAAAITTAAAWIATTHRTASITVIALLVCFAAALLGPHLRLVRAASAAEFFVAAAVAVALWRSTMTTDWLPIAVAAGYLSHLLADAVTVSGIRPLLVARNITLRLGRLRTGGATETALGSLAVLGVVALTYIHIARPLLPTQ